MTITRRGFKAVETNAAQRTKALTVKFMHGEYKTLRLYAMDKDELHLSSCCNLTLKFLCDQVSKCLNGIVKLLINKGCK